VTSRTSRDFWRLFAALPADARQRAYKAYRLFQQNPAHPSLQFKEVGAKHHLWSARVSRGLRVLGQRAGDEITWTWIGGHDEYMELINKH
jgi:hypothetical protein